jgi:hypothetical protein
MSKLTALVLSTLLIGCDDSPIQDPHAPKSPPAVATTALTPGTPTGSAEEDAPLRRTYGAADIKFGACAVLLADGSIEAKGCPNGIVTYGPYITAPANSSLSLTFDIKSTAPVTVGGDIISRDGDDYLAHAVLKPVTVEPGSVQNVQQQVHFAKRAMGTEARISIKANTLATVTLSNVKIAIQ